MNLNINCYNLTDQLDRDEAIKGTSFIIQIPFRAYKLLKVIDNNLYVIVDIDSMEQSYIQLTFIPPGWDIKYIDNNLNDDPYQYEYLGQYNTEDFVFLFGRVLSDKETKEIEK